MRTIRSNIHQALTGRGFPVAVLGAALVLLLSSIERIIAGFRAPDLLSFGYHNDLIEQALAGDAMTLALPILAALPYTASLVEDIKSGFYKAYLPRTTIVDYLAGKVLACALAGGLALLAGVALAWGVCALMFLPKELPPASVDALGNSLRYVSPIWGKLLLAFASGGFWAVLGMLFATLTMSRYMAYASPFVIYYVLIILYERYFDFLYIFYPKEWLNPSPLWEYGNAGVLLVVGELTLIAGVLAARAGRRHIADG